MRREMITVPALLAFSAFCLSTGHTDFSIGAFGFAMLDAFTGRA